MTSTGTDASPEKTLTLFRRFWPLMRPDRWRLVGAVLLLLVATACELAGVWVFGRITDDVLTTGVLGALVPLAVFWLGAAALGGLAHFVGDWLSAAAAERFVARLRNHTFGHVVRLSPGTVDRMEHGDLVARLTDDVEEVEEIVGSGPVQAVSAALSVLAFAVAALILRWELALLTFAAAPLLWFAARRFSRRIGAVAQDERETNGEVVAVVEESVSAVALVQAYNREELVSGRAAAAGGRWARLRIAQARTSGAYGPLVSVVETVCVLAIVGVGAWEIGAGRLSLGGLLTFAGFVSYLYPPVQSLGQLALGLAAARAAGARITELLDTAPEVTNRPGALRPDVVRGELELRSVGYRYPGAGRPALEDLSVRVPAGRTVVVVGASGAGKSTLTRLLLRFVDPESGQLLLDGVDLRDYSLDALRNYVTLLPQETTILHGTVRENIAFGRPDATDADIVAAATAADADLFIRALSDGYDTVLGDRGRFLSGGQRQRIAIARALLRNSPVLVLDEPTTGLDTDAVRRLLGPLRRLMAGRTTVLITHDLRLATEADHVVVLAGGQVAEQGAPADLHRTDNGHYRALLHRWSVAVAAPSR
ncbi:ABC transporter ATP-binding protein [Cryptosporangium minutisporangium]|uniref:ABC transporter ATP-binding protein n=1 Tax=Cryptosporangium minutisporangium TaxID=113569 RepID=A0ABP6T3A4_9ACTN